MQKYFEKAIGYKPNYFWAVKNNDQTIISLDIDIR